MARNAAPSPTYATVCETIRAWPAAQRLTLVQDVLATLTPAVAGAPRQPTLPQAIWLLATDPPPGDARAGVS